jgi:hypothetical protein
MKMQGFGDYVAVRTLCMRVHHGVCLMWTRARGDMPAAKGFRDYVSGKMVQGFKDVVFALEMVKMVKGFRDYVSVVKIDVVVQSFRDYVSVVKIDVVHRHFEYKQRLI